MKDRLRQIINYTGLKQTEFADKLKVQRSNISHFLSGRNKPRVDFLEKLKQAYPEINLEWFIMGTGEMLIKEEKPKEKKEDTSPPDDTPSIDDDGEQPDKIITTTTDDGSASEIIIIYSDKTFDTYKKRT